MKLTILFIIAAYLTWLTGCLPSKEPEVQTLVFLNFNKNGDALGLALESFKTLHSDSEIVEVIVENDGTIKLRYRAKS